SLTTYLLTLSLHDALPILAGILNRQVMEQNFSMWVTGDQEFKEMEDAVSSFFKDYKRFRKDFPEAVQEWTFETVAKVTHQSDSRSEEHTSELQSRENLVCR